MEMMDNGRLRADAGFIATLINLDNPSDLRVVHRNGLRETVRTPGVSFSQALTSLCDEIEGWDGRWRFQTISTPRSVYTDLTERSEEIRTPQTTHETREQIGQLSYEQNVLGRLGRRHLAVTPPWVGDDR